MILSLNGRVAVWGIVGIFAGAMIALTFWTSYLKRIEAAAWLVSPEVKAVQAENLQVVTLMKQGHGTITRKDLEIVLNNGIPLNDGKSWTSTHIPTARWNAIAPIGTMIFYEFHFNEVGHVIGYSSTVRYPQRPTKFSEALLNFIHLPFAGIGAILFGFSLAVLAALSFFEPNWRKSVAECGLAISILCLVADVTQIDSTVTVLGHITETGTLVWFTFALAFLVLLLIRSHSRSKSTMLLCSNCSYNLTGNESGICPECGVAIAFRK